MAAVAVRGGHIGKPLFELLFILFILLLFFVCFCSGTGIAYGVGLLLRTFLSVSPIEA